MLSSIRGRHARSVSAFIHKTNEALSRTPTVAGAQRRRAHLRCLLSLLRDLCVAREALLDNLRTNNNVRHDPRVSECVGGGGVGGSALVSLSTYRDAERTDQLALAGVCSS